MDKGAAFGLVLLGLSAAFDTIDHSILFNCLQHWYDIDGVELKLVQLCLSGFSHTSFRCFSTPLWGFSGLSSGATHFNHVCNPSQFSHISIQCYHNFYADDTQIYLELDSRNFDSSIIELTNCLEAVQAWMGNNILKLNPDKMEFIVIGDDQIKSSLKSSFPLSFLGIIMELAELAKFLGVILDAENSMQRQVANALISSRPDYCNSLLFHTKRNILSNCKEFKMPYVVLCEN